MVIFSMGGSEFCSLKYKNMKELVCQFLSFLSDDILNSGVGTTFFRNKNKVFSFPQYYVESKLFYLENSTTPEVTFYHFL